MKKIYLNTILGLLLSVTASASEVTELQELSVIREVDPSSFEVLIDLKIQAAVRCSKTVYVKELLGSAAFNESIVLLRARRVRVVVLSSFHSS